MKLISQRKREELIDLLNEFNIELPTIVTKETLKNELMLHGITDDKLRKFGTKEELEKEQDKKKVLSGMVVVKMDRNNSLYQFKTYVFTKKDRMVLMSELDAKELLGSQNGFHIASREEIEQFYK